VDFAEIEERLIAPAELPEDERSALWLLAWCERDHVSKRK
jgi:hypothetical protein